jgi:hypothetical protein
MQAKHLVVALIAVAGLAAGQDDPPSRVARLSYLSGSVSFQPGDVDDWTAASLNYPLTSGDRLWTDEDSRAELQIGSSVLRLASSTSFSFLNLDDRTVQASVSEGALLVRLRELDQDEVFEVDTPNLAVSLLQPGVYRIDVDADGNTSVTVREGEAEVTGGSAFRIYPRQTARVYGDDTPASEILEERPFDQWERWAQDRDRRDEESVSARYVSPDTIGYRDLDEYGAWHSIPEYGAVWAPAHVDAGWAPYRFGRWAWVEPWGWTWIDDAPWGFAPFHYGRWVWWNSGWYWVPGAITRRPVYAPALVVFVGGNRWSASLSLGGPGVAWFPLGPREVYRPGYHASDGYIRRMNVHVTNINIDVTNVRYVNQRVPGAVTAVTRDTFASGRPLGRRAVVVPVRAVTAAAVGRSIAQIAPRRESVLVGGGAPVRRPPVAAVTRTVVTRRAPPPPPVSFAARERALAANPGRPLDPAARSRLRQSQPPATRQPYRIAPRVTMPAVQAPPPRQMDRPAQPPVETMRPAQQDRPPQPVQVERPRPVQVERPPQPTQVERPRPAQVERPPQPAQVERPRPAQVERPPQPAQVERTAPPARTTPPAEVERTAPPERTTPPAQTARPAAREIQQRAQPRTETRQAPAQQKTERREAPKQDRGKDKDK